MDRGPRDRNGSTNRDPNVATRHPIASRGAGRYARGLRPDATRYAAANTRVELIGTLGVAAGHLLIPEKILVRLFMNARPQRRSRESSTSILVNALVLSAAAGSLSVRTNINAFSYSCRRSIACCSRTPDA